MITKNIFNRYLALAITLVFTSAAVWAAPGDVISFNFHQDDSGNKGPLVGDQVTLEGTIPAEHWNSNKKNLASGNWQNGSNSKTLVYNVNSNVGSECEATCAWTFSASHFYGGAAGNYSNENYFMKCIAAPQAGGSGTETLTISNIPFTKYYAVIYISNWDIGHNTSFKLGETNYSVSATGLAIPDSTADWGGTATPPVYGTNAVKIDNLSGDFSFSMTAAKCNVCAIQIVDDAAAPVGEKVVWSNLDSDAAKATHYTRNNATLSLPESETYPIGTKIKINSIKFFNNSSKDMRSYMTLNEVDSDPVVTESCAAVTSGNYTFNQMFIFNFTTTPLIVDIGESYTITGSDNTGLQYPGIQTDGVIDIGVGGYKALCAVEGEVYTPAGYRVEMEETEITLSADAPVKAFSGIKSLSMLKSKFEVGEVSAMFGGAWIDPTKAVQAFVQDTETETSLTYQFQVNDDSHLKMVIVEFTLGADGIYAKQIAQGYVSGKGEELLGQKILTSGGDYTFSSVGVANYTITSISAPAVVKAVGDDKVDVEFTPANDEDWADLILPTKAKGVEAKGNMSFASRNTYKQTLGEREATVALVADAQEGNLIYGLHAFNTAGLGPINRDIYLMMNGGTAGVLSGGEDATYNATKTVLTGNTLLNLKGESIVDYIYGAGLGGGSAVTTTGDIGVVVEEDAQVKGSIVAGWQSRHNSTPKVVGNTSVLVKNVQTNYQSASITSGNFSCSQGWIVGGGLFWGNGGKSTVDGNALITLDIPSDKSGEFMKHITAGGHAEGGGDGNNVTGNSSVVITAPNTVSFPKNIMGGGHSTGTNKAKVGGNSSVTINGGTYTGTIYAAGDNGEHTLVSGTATLTITGGNFDGATLKGGIATGTKTLNVSGTTSKLNVSGFNNVTISSAAKLAITEAIEGNLTIADTGASFVFPAGTEAGAEVVVCSGTLTYGEDTTGVFKTSGDVLVGDLVKRGTVTINLDEKKISYALASVLHSYTFTSDDFAQISAADVDNGGVCHLAWDNPKNFAADCVFTGIDSDKYVVWVENDINLYVAKKTNSISIKFTPASDTEGTIAKSDGNVGGFPVAGVFWNHSKQYTGTQAGTTEILKVKDGNGEVLADTRVFYYMPNMYDVNKRGTGVRNYQTTGNGKLTYSYFDDANRAESPAAGYEVTGTIDEVSETYTLPQTPDGRLRWEVGIKSVPYEVFDLYIYHASDQSSAVINLLPIAVKANNGEWNYFAGDGNGSTIAATVSDRWQGAPYCDSLTMVEGTNYIRYRMSAAALGLAEGERIDTIYLAHPAPTNGRLGLAGIQLVEVEDDGIYSRAADPEDMGGDDDNRNLWSRENSWLNSAGEAMNYPTSGERSLTIDADTVKAIKTDGVIEATKITLINTPAAEGEEPKSFKFLTMEPLSTVNDLSIDPEFIIKAPVDATKFNGQLYLQSRIEGVITLGANARITFVSDVEGEETTAYPYNIKGDASVTLSGPGSFLVPSSMYTAPFTVNEGSLRYAAEGNVTGAISGSGDIVIDPGEGKSVTLSGNNANFTGSITVKSGTLKMGRANCLGAFDYNRTIQVLSGAALDTNGVNNGWREGTTYNLTLAEGSIYKNSARPDGDIKAAFPISSLTLEGNATMIADGFECGLTRHFNGSTAINLNGHTLSLTGTTTSYLSCPQVSGEGTIRVVSGGMRIAHNSGAQPSIPAATLELCEGTTLTLVHYTAHTSLTVKNLILNGAVQKAQEADPSVVTITGKLSGKGTSSAAISLAADSIWEVADEFTVNDLTFNGSAITGTGTIKVPQTGSLTISTEVTSTAAFMLAKGGSFTAAQSVKFASFVLGEDYSTAEIDGIANLSFDTLTLEDGATLDMTAKIRYPYYTLGATQNGKIKITTPTSRKRIAQVVAGNASGITLVDENGEELDSCVYGGYLYYGTLCTDTEVSADEIAANVVYPSNTTVNGVDVDHYSVNDGKGGIAVATKTDSININFGAVDETSGMVDTADTNVGAFPVSGASWNNSLTNLKDGKGESTTISVVIKETSSGFPPYGATANTVAANMQQNGNQKLTYGYLDNAEGKVWAVTLSNIPYDKFDLYLIAANNGETDENGKISSLPFQITVDNNAPAYYGGSIAGTVDSIWNMKPYAEGAMIEGENFIKIKFNHKPTTLSIGHPSLNEGVCSLAAIQIVEDKSESDGVYIRRSDADLEKDGIEKTWTAANSWLDSDGNPTTWSADGSHIVTINADTVSEITINDKIAADSVTVTNTAADEGEAVKTFKFLTLEPLDEVDKAKEDAPYRLDAPVSLTGFHGEVYLQSRITGQIQLGQYAHIVFVAMVEGEETTAYQYDFNGTIQPIRKIGPGTFVVPASMYGNVPFNIDAGFIKYDYNGETVASVPMTISGNGGLVKTGSGTVLFGGNNTFKGGTQIKEGTVQLGNNWALGEQGALVRVEKDAVLDVNGKTQFGSNLTLNGGMVINSGTGANLNHVQFKSISLEADSVLDLANSTAIINNNYNATTLNLNNHTLIKRGTADFYVANVTANAGTIKLEAGALKVHNNACNFAAVDLVVAGTVQFNGNDAPTVFKTLTFEAGGALTQPNGKMLTVSDKLSGSGSIQNLTLQDGATVELGEEGVITVTGTLAFGNTLKIKGGAFDKAAFAFTTEPTALPSNVILVNDEGVGTSGYYFNLVNGKLVIANNEARDISGVVTVSTDIPSWTTTRMKLTDDTVFVIDTVEGMPSAINFIADNACNLAFVYAAPYEGTLTFTDNITVEKKYAPEAWSLVPATIGPGPIVTIIGYDTQEEADAAGNDFSSAITVQEGGVLHLERLIKLSAENNVNQGGTLEIVEDTTPDAPATFAKVRFSNQGMKGALNIGKNTTYYPFGYPDQLWYSGTTSIVNVYGTLDMSDSSNARWTLRQGITINFYVGAKAIGLGQQTTGEHNSAFQFNSANCVLNFLKDGDKGGEIDFDLRLRPQHVFTMNIEEGVIVNMGGSLNMNVDNRQPFVVTGGGKVVVDGTYEFCAPPEVAPEQLEIAESGSLTVKSWIDYEFNGDVTSIGTDTGALTFEGNGFTTDTGYLDLGDGNKAIYTGVAPYRNLDINNVTEWTAAIYGTFPRLKNGAFIGLGSFANGITLANGENEDSVMVLQITGQNNPFVKLFEVMVPEAHTKDHLYAVVRTANSVKLYVDGKLRGIHNGTVAMSGGLQIGCVYGGVMQTGVVKFCRDAFNGNVDNAVLRASHIDVLRIYKFALGTYANEILAQEMGYTASGTYTRELSENKTYTWEDDGAWKKGDETFSKPAADSEVKISVPDENVSATLTITETTNIGSLTISGAGKLGVVAENEAKLVNYGDTIIDGVYASVKYDAVDFTHGGISLLNKGAIDFDFSGYNVNQIVERTAIPVTGITEELDEVSISITKPGQMPSRTMTLEYNESAKRYEVVITIDREAGEVVWNDEGDIAYGKSVLANGVTSVLFPGDSLVIDSEVSAANGVPGLGIRVAEGGSLKLTGGQNPATLQIDEGGVYDVNGGAVVPATLKLNGGKLTNSAATEVQPLATTLDMMADSIVDGNVAFGALTLNGTGTITINEGASIKHGGAVTKSANSELNVINDGIITLTSGTVPQFNTLTGAGYIEFAQLNAPGEVQLVALNSFTMPIHLKGISGSAYLGSVNLAVNNNLVIDGSVAFNQGSSNKAYALNEVSGSGAFTLSTWGQCTGLSYTINELNNYTGSLSIVNNATGNCTYSFAIGNIVTDKIVYSTPLVKLTRTISREANSISFDISTVQLNGAETTLLMLEEDGIYHASATYNGTNYRDVNAAIEAAGEEHIGDITVYDANAILTGDYIIKNDDGVLSIVPVDKTEITTNTRVSTWTESMNERLVIDGSANEVTVTFDAKIPEAIKEVRLVGNVKLVAEGAKVIETSKLKGMEGAKLTILSDIEGDFEVKSAIKLDNVALSHAVMTDAEIEITGEVKLAGIRAASLYAHNATLKTVDGMTHKFPASRTMRISGTVTIDSTLEIAAGATLTINAESAATLKLLKSKIGEGAISLTENVTLYIPEGVQVLNVKGAGKVDGAGLISNEGALSSVYPVNSWTGIYKLKGLNSSAGWLDPDNFGNINSKVMIVGFVGYFQISKEFKPEMVFEDEDSLFAFTSDNGSSNSNVVFRKISGSGTIVSADTTNAGQKFVVKDTVNFYGNIEMVNGNRGITIGDTSSAADKQIVVAENKIATIGAGKHWNAGAGIVINGTIKGSGTLASATTFGATSIIDVSEGNLTLGAGVTLPETINIKGAKSGSVIIAGVPAGTTVPKFNLIDNPGSLELKLQSDGQLVLVGQEVTISIPELEHAHYEVFANGKPVIVQNGSITVDSGTEITVTYTPELGFVGGGSLTTTIVNGLTPIRSDLISVKKGVKVVIHEYKGAKVKTIEGLDEDGIATEGVTINGDDYHPISEAVDGVLLIEIH